MPDTPTRPSGTPKPHSFTARLHLAAKPAQIERYRRAADAGGVTLSEWARVMLDAAARRQLGDG